MSTYRLVLQTIHRLGGEASTELVAHTMQQEVAHVIRYAARNGLLSSPGAHGRNLNPWKLTRLGTAYVEGFAERRPWYPHDSKYPQQIIGYSWMAPLMESPEALSVASARIDHARPWYELVRSEKHGTPA